jgi:hypothetical protein
MPQSSPGETVGPIIFADDTARSQLREHGEVVTFRKSARTTGDTWWRKSRLGTKEGDVTVEEIGVVNPTNSSALAPHQPLSGFTSVDAWQQAIASLNENLPDQGRLYRVETRD